MKYKGFTLIEITLALSLTGIMLLLGGEVWQILAQVHALYTDNQERSYEEIRLRTVLEYDLNQHRHWQQIGQHWQADDSLRYFFHTGEVIRQQSSKSDTFRFSLYVQPFMKERVFCLMDSTDQVWFRYPLWPLARAIP